MVFMGMVEIVTQSGIVKVESERLAENLRKAAELAKYLSLRPGQIIYDSGSANRTSLEKSFTEKTIAETEF